MEAFVLRHVAKGDGCQVGFGGHQTRGFVEGEGVRLFGGLVDGEVDAVVVAVEGGARVVVGGDGNLVDGVVAVVRAEWAFIVVDGTVRGSVRNTCG